MNMFFRKLSGIRGNFLVNGLCWCRRFQQLFGCRCRILRLCNRRYKQTGLGFGKFQNQQVNCQISTAQDLSARNPCLGSMIKFPLCA